MMLTYILWVYGNFVNIMDKKQQPLLNNQLDQIRVT